MKPVLRSHMESDAVEAATLLMRVERVAFGSMASALFALGFIVLVYGSATFLASVLTEPHRTVTAAGRLLDAALLVLILLQLTYTLILRSKGAPLSAEPFVMISIVAIVRQVLSLTTSGALLDVMSLLQIGVLTAATLVLAGALAVIRRKPLR